MIIPRIYTGLKSHSDSAVARLNIHRCVIGEPNFCCWIFFSHHNTASTFQLACQMLLKADHLLCNGLKATLRYLLRGDVSPWWAVLRLIQMIYYQHQRNMGQQRKEPWNQDNQEVMLCKCGGVGGVVAWNVLASQMHARTSTRQFYPSHLKAHSPSYSTVVQSLTTDIILIAHHGRVVCPHRHPDSLCAENPTTENSGLRVSGGLWTAETVCCVF